MKKQSEQTHHLFTAKKKDSSGEPLFLYFYKSYKKPDAVDDIVITI